MKIRSVGALGVVVLLVQVLGDLGSAAPAAVGQQQQLQQNPWIERRAQFYKNTTFELSKDNLRLLGGRFASVRTAHLPFWFDFELFKTVFKKSYPDVGQELARHRIYISACVRTLKERVMYRILASNVNPTITSKADLSFIERIPTEAPNIINGLDAQAAAAAAAMENEPPRELGSGGIEFAAELELDLDSDAAAESPLERAVRLVRSELDLVESRNQLENYLGAFEETDGSAIEGQLPY